MTLTIGREDTSENNCVPDKQYTLCPHCQWANTEENRITLLGEDEPNITGRDNLAYQQILSELRLERGSRTRFWPATH